MKKSASGAATKQKNRGKPPAAVVTVDVSAAENWPLVWGILGLVVLVLAVYYPMLHSGYDWDDNSHFRFNSFMNNLSGLKEIWLNPRQQANLVAYYPVTMTVFWLQYQLFGAAHAAPLHAVSLAMHCINVLLVWRILRRLKLNWAWLAASLFAIHPIQVETVAWISEQKNLLSTMFSLLAADTYLTFNQAIVPVRRWGNYFLSLFLFALAMLSKAVVVPLPVVLLFVLWWRQGRIRWRDVLNIMPMFVLGLGISALFAWVNLNLHSQEADIAFTTSQRVLIAGHALWFYIGKLLWPAELLSIYPLWDISGAWWQYLYPAGVVVAAGMLAALRRRLGLGPLVAVLIFILMLSPALGLVSFSYLRFSYVADHFSYLANLAIFVLVSETLRRVALWLGAREAQPAKGWRGPVLAELVFALVLIVLLAPLTWAMCCRRQSGISVWQYTVDHNPHSWMAHAMLATSYYESGAYEKTLQEATLSEALSHNSAATVMEARALDHMGKPAEALPIWQDYINRGWAVPRAYADYARDLKQTGQYELAIQAYRKAVAADPMLLDAWNSLATIYLEGHQWPQAADAAQRCLDLQETFQQAHGKLAYALQYMGNLDGAILHYQRYLELDSTNVREVVYTRLQLGRCLRLRGRLTEAMAQMQQIIALVPDHLDAHKELFLILLAMGDKAGAALEQQRISQIIQGSRH